MMINLCLSDGFCYVAFCAYCIPPRSSNVSLLKYCTVITHLFFQRVSLHSDEWDHARLNPKSD
jgi:hypothetical protein